MTFIDFPEEGKQKDEAKSNNTQEPKKTSNPHNDSQWGYDMYPDRRRPANKEMTMSGFLKGQGKENLDKIKCERNVYKCIKNSPLVKLMLGALKSSGCEIDIRRHIACEECAPNVSGGYDPILNQVVICHNTVTREGMVQGVLTHEFIHMFDYCRHKLNFKNIDHLACTEIRAANLAHCSFISACLNGDASPLKIKQAHQDCVKSKALSSIMAVRNVTKLEAIDAIERVFSKCYADLEPIGRRIRRNSEDMYKAYEEGFYYGYDAS